MRNDELCAAVEKDLDRAEGLDERRQAMLRYALKLTRTPKAMTEVDLAPLRAAGFSDLDILHIAETTAYYAYVNRIADGLGVEPEEDLKETLS
ncbi:MAG: hypothetical protein AAF368_11150 [Planctomycetota bacterium]